MDDTLPIDALEPSPGITGAPLRDLHPAWIKAERFGWWIFDSILLIPALVVASIATFRSGDATLATILFASWALLAALMLWATIAYPKAAYRHAAIALGDLGLEYRRGVWWRKTTIIPRSRVQHTDVSQGPVMRRFGLGKLVVHTAGTRNAVVEIQGLGFDEAERIRDRLLDRTHPPSDTDDRADTTQPDNGPTPSPSSSSTTSPEAPETDGV